MLDEIIIIGDYNHIFIVFKINSSKNFLIFVFKE